VRRYIYHFHVFWQLKPGEMSHNDGVILRDAPVNTPAGYVSAREALEQKYSVPKGRLTIGAFSYLGRESFFASVRRALPGTEK